MRWEVITSLLLCSILVPFRGAADNLYCVTEETTLVNINSDRQHLQQSNNNLCTYPSGERHLPNTVRNCFWQINLKGLRQPAHLALELFITELGRTQMRTFDEHSNNSRSFVKILNTTQHGRCTKYYQWDEKLHFHLFQMHNEQDYIDVSLELYSQELAHVADIFFLRISHSKSGFCSRGLVLQDRKCLAVRVTDRVAQAATFPVWSKATKFMAAYRKLAKDGGLEPDEERLIDSPIRLGAAWCGCATDAGEELVAFWQRHPNGSCSCGSATIPSDSLRPGSGDCLAMQTDAKGTLTFMPTACSGGAQPTLLSFPSEPASGVCSDAGSAATSDQCRLELLKGRCCACPQQQLPSEGRFWKFLLVVLVLLAVLIKICCSEGT